MRSSLNLVAIVAVCCVTSLPARSWAQSDAEIALGQARTAFANDQFEQARDLLVTASQTDAENPDIFLLLGKAHYQLGDVDAAIKAWQTTLKLAPDQAYARRMFDALQGKIVDAAVRIEVVKSLLDEDQAHLALNEITAIRRLALTQEQRSELLLLEATALLRDLANTSEQQAATALKSLRELTVRDPEQAESAAVRLLTGRARLGLGAITEAITILEAVKAEFADTAEGRAAELTMIAFRIHQGENVVDDLAAWITANAEHPDLRAARATMIRAVGVFLQEASRVGQPQDPDAFSAAETAALAAARHALGATRDAEVSLEFQQLVAYIQSHWIQRGSFEKVNTAINQLLELDLATARRVDLEQLLVRSRHAVASGELEKLLVDLGEGDAVPADLANWIETHGDHPRLTEARLRLVSAYVEQTRRRGNPARDAQLSELDVAAVALAEDLLESLETGVEKSAMVHGLIVHFKTHYSNHGAYGAAISGLQSLVALELPRSVRHTAMIDLASAQSEAALARIEAAVTAGTLASGPLPPDLVAALQTFDTINKEFPDQPAWGLQATIGKRLADQSNRVTWPATVTQIKTTDQWAIEFLLPVIVARHDPSTTELANNAFAAMIGNIAAIQQKSARGLASRTHQRLLDLMKETDKQWPAAVMRQLGLRIVDDELTFRENIAAGRGHLNAELSDHGRSLLELASKLVTGQPNRAAEVLNALTSFLTRRSEAGYESVVQQAYAILESQLPPAERRTVQLAVARSWINRVIAAHNRLMATGLRPPEELDEKLRQALIRCYELQSELEPNHEFVTSVQQVRAIVIAHYRNLQYHETAAEAISVKAEQAVGWIDAAAEFELAGLRLSIALDELSRQTRQFQGRENLTITPAVREAIAGFEQFIVNRSEDRHVGAAVETILSVGNTYSTYEKHDLAAEIYAGLETFAAATEALQTSPPDQPKVAERAALAVASALHVKASSALAETIENQPEQSDPPSELSAEFRAAIAACEAILDKYPDSLLVSSTIGKMMDIALEYAQVGSWDVAEGVYASLLEQDLPLRHPERLEFARALCEIGKVIPEHAQQMLSAITVWQRDSPAGPDDAQMGMIAGIGGGGLGGGAGFGGQAGLGGALGPATMDEEMDMEAFAEAPAGAAAPLDPFGDQIANMPGQFRDDDGRATRQMDLMAAIRRQQSAVASRVAMMRENEIQHVDRLAQQAMPNQQAAQVEQAPDPVVPVLSEAEIARRAAILDAAYEKLQAIRKTYVDSSTARQAREQILVIANHWRSIKQWQRSAAVVKRFLDDNPSDLDLPKLRHEIARDFLAWASGAATTDLTKQELLDEVNKRFTLAREELAGIIAAFPENQQLKHLAQWDIANSHLSQARVVAGFSSTLARGQFVRAANELLATAERYHDHPQITEIPQMLWNIAQELTTRRFFDEAITVWNDMTLHYPGHALAEQAALQIARTYQNQLRLPLRAVESYLELNFARGGNDTELQNAIFEIANQLKNEKRWVEALHVLETFVDSFPQHTNAGQAITMIGQVHQTNEVWEDAIAAYRRVILEYNQGNWAQQSKWSIAECTINLSRWEEAQGAYREYQKAYPEDPKVAEATKRMEILKDLARFQKVVDEDGQRKAFDAQYQIATIVRSQLANPVKAIIEYRKVAQRWPNSHLADDALFQVGMIYMELGQTENARDAFFATADRYPTSPLADDALFQVGASYENEAQVLAGVTRGKAVEIASAMAQRQAYAVSQGKRRQQRARNLDQIAQLKKEGKSDEADRQTAFQAALNVAFDNANASVVANWAAQQEEALTTAQLADRQDKINAALRQAVASFRRAASVASADKADDALLRMAQIYDQRLKDSDAAMATWLEIVKQYSGTTVAEDASWKIAQYYETHEKYADAIAAYNSFLRNYRRSPKASDAQAAIAENHEQLGNWVEAMDAYTNYINNYPDGTMAQKAREQIAWIKTYRL